MGMLHLTVGTLSCLRFPGPTRIPVGSRRRSIHQASSVRA